MTRSDCWFGMLSAKWKLTGKPSATSRMVQGGSSRRYSVPTLPNGRGPGELTERLFVEGNVA